MLLLLTWTRWKAENLSLYDRNNKKQKSGPNGQAKDSNQKTRSAETRPVETLHKKSEQIEVDPRRNIKTLKK